MPPLVGALHTVSCAMYRISTLCPAATLLSLFCFFAFLSAGIGYAEKLG